MIIFKNLTFKNILSVGNAPVTIDLNDSKTTLIHGANGSGKSTILDAVCFALFGKGFRKVNLGQLVNSQNKKGMLVELEFSIGNTEFRVLRGQKPKVFQLFKDGEEIDKQAADKDNQLHLEQNILKLSYKSFTQTVILGSSNFVPFMQLSTAHRRECVEDFLDIKVFSTMSVIAKERLRAAKDNVRVIQGDIGNLEYKIDLQEQRIKELSAQSKSEIQGYRTKISAAESHAIELSKDTLALRGMEKTLLEEVRDLGKGDPTKKLGEFNKFIIKFGNKAERLKKNVAFYQDNDVCHTCNQDLAEETKSKYINESNTQLSELNEAVAGAQKHIESYQKTVDAISEKQEAIASFQRRIFEAQTELKGYAKDIKSYENAITEIERADGSIDKEQGKLELMQDDLSALKSRSADAQSLAKSTETAVSLLKDSGIKTQIVKKYLPVMNKCIRKYLTELDLPIHFTLDNEFNESVSSPLHQDFSYASFSEGQKGRIDLALLFTWREIGRLKNSVSTNILFLDEVFSSSLDETGKEQLLFLLRYKLEDTNVIVVDHTLSGTFKDKFDRQIEVNRIGGFSRYN